MRTILIDPVARSFTEVDYNGDWKTISTHLGCHNFDVVFTDVGDVYVDDEGLFQANQSFFVIEGCTPLAGRGLVFGHVDEEGDSTAATVTIDELVKKVTFMDAKKVMDMFN
jgi:hypothetical protein